MLPPWPPKLTEEQLEELTLLASTYALSHGLLYLPHTTSDGQVAPTSAIHAPFTLFPSPFPKKLFQRAQRLQSAYNILYSRIAMDEAFLDRVMGEVDGVGKVDRFVGTLWKGWKDLRDKGMVQPLQLGIFRSDYLMHTTPNELELKQVEFNTISSSFGPLSQAVSNLHRYLYASNYYYYSSPLLHQKNFPPNHTTAGLISGFVEAHETYGVQDAYVLFVVQNGERNIFDQRWLEYELLGKHGIHVIRQTFKELASSASLNGEDKALRITTPLHRQGVEISIVYFRAGYTPNDYTDPSDYETRFLLESSRAIKCPSIPLQLAGGKKVQQVLTRPGILESFLCNPKWGKKTFGRETLGEMRSTWMGMWGLDETEQLQQQGVVGVGVDRARERAYELVLKPQREGGGNNIYKSAIPAFLDSLDEKEREAWIAMELIRVPEGSRNWLVRVPPPPSTASASASSPVAPSSNGKPVEKEVVSELGIFGWSLFGRVSDVSGKNQYQIEESGYTGWLVRTKGKESDEGGVAVGYSVLDSIVLVD